ncbi:MAG: TonB-dependent receptor [Halioglobus sp.]
MRPALVFARVNSPSDIACHFYSGVTREARVSASALLGVVLLSGAPSVAVSQEEERVLEVVEVVGSLRSLPTEDVGSVFGFDKTLLEVPRSASTISADQLARFDMRDIDELIALAPGTFTQSFFGVAGSLDVRGTAGEVYFRGTRRLDNPGNYPTPIGATDRVDIVRGPASPIMGPAKMGGYLNFVPKSARAVGGAYMEEAEGRLSYSTGSWDRNIFTAEVGGPGTIGSRKFGYYLFGEIEDSGSYYENSGTRQEVLQAAIDFDLNDSTRFEFGTMYHDFDGNQIAGWNRLTQALIDDGTYTTGSPPGLDTDGDGYISHQEYLGADGGPDAFGNSLLFPFVQDPEDVTESDLTPSMALTNPGTTRLDGDQVLVASGDTLENESIILYFDFIHSTKSGWEFKNQLYYEDSENLNENAYGFSQFSDPFVVEDKFVISYSHDGRNTSSSLQLSPSIRYTEFDYGIDFANEYYDRRDLTGPSTALDRRLLSTQSGTDYSWNTYGDYTVLGLAALWDFEFLNGLGFMLGLRWDDVDVTSVSREGLLLGNSPDASDIKSKDSESDLSWTASVSWATELGLVPYITASRQTTVIAGQGSEILGELIESNTWFDQSELLELGVKGSFLEDSLYFALAAYNQERTDSQVQSIAVNQTNEAEGIEFEARWVVNEHLLLTAGWSKIDIYNLNTIENGGRYSYFGAEDIPQIDPTLIYGGAVNGLPPANSREEARRAGIPEKITTFTATYSFNSGWAVNASIIDVDSTPSGYTQVVQLPSYTLVNLGVIYEGNTWSFSLTGKNLTDEHYYRANFPNLYGSQIVLPEKPAHWVASLAYYF